MREKGGSGHEERDAEEATARQAEETAEKTVKEAKSNRVSGPAYEPADDGGEEHDSDGEDREEGDDVTDGGRRG